MMRAKHGNTKKLRLIYVLCLMLIGAGYLVFVQIAPVVVADKFEEKVRSLEIQVEND